MKINHLFFVMEYLFKLYLLIYVCLIYIVSSVLCHGNYYILGLWTELNNTRHLMTLPCNGRFFFVFFPSFCNI